MYLNKREGEQYNYKKFTTERNPKTAFLNYNQSQYPENNSHSVQYHRERNNQQAMQQLGLRKYDRNVVYKNDLEHTLMRLNSMKTTSMENSSKKKNLILAGVCGLLFLLFLIFCLASSGGWSTFWLILSILCLLAAIFFLVAAFVLSKKHYEKQLRDRRDSIRNYLRSENDRYYHKRGLHWKPSRECSYLLLKDKYRELKDDEEVWLTGRKRPDQWPWGQTDPNKPPPMKVHDPQTYHSQMLQEERVDSPKMEPQSPKPKKSPRMQKPTEVRKIIQESSPRPRQEPTRQPAVQHVEIKQSNLVQRPGVEMQKSQPSLDNESKVVIERARKTPETYKQIDNSRSSIQGNKYVNKGLSKGKSDLDNSVMQPLNSSIVRDRSPEQKIMASRRYVNQDIVKRSSTPNRTSIGTVQRGINPLSPTQPKTRVLQSRVLTSNNPPTRVIQASPEQRPVYTSTVMNKDMPWSSIPKKEITLQNASQVQQKPAYYRQTVSTTTPTKGMTRYVNRKSIEGTSATIATQQYRKSTPQKYSNATRVISNYPPANPAGTTTTTTVIQSKPVIKRPEVNYESNTPQQIKENWNGQMDMKN